MGKIAPKMIMRGEDLARDFAHPTELLAGRAAPSVRQVPPVQEKITAMVNPRQTLRDKLPGSKVNGPFGSERKKIVKKMERHMRTTLALVIAGLLAATIASTWLIGQSDAELTAPAAGSATALSPLEMMKNVRDLPVSTVADFI